MRTNVYTRAAETLKKWRAEHVLREETTPALYGYSQTYTVPGTGGTTESRQRFASGVASSRWDSFPTTPTRLCFGMSRRFRSTSRTGWRCSKRRARTASRSTCCTPIRRLRRSSVIFEAPPSVAGDSKTVPHVTRMPDLEIVDEYHVVHRVWKVTDRQLIQRVLDAMKDKWLLIADGHHRYETSVAYMHERADRAALSIRRQRRR